MELILNNLYTVVDLIPLWQDDKRRLRLCLGVVFSLINFVVIYHCLSRLVKNYIVHEAVPKINQIRLVNAVWRVVFSVGVITVFIGTPWDTLHSRNNTFRAIMEPMQFPLCNQTMQRHSKDPSSLDFSLVAPPVAFFLHQIYVSISEGLKPAIASMGCFAMFVFVADPVKCPNLCIAVLLLLSLSIGSLEVAKIFYILKSRCRGFEGPLPPLLIRIVAPFLFFLHVLAWSIVNFYLLPVLFLSLPSVTQVDAHSRSKVAYTNIFLLFLFRHQFFDMPVWSLLKLVVKRPTDVRRMRSLLSLPAVVLLPYTSSLLPELRAIQMNFLLNALPTSAERRMIRKKILSSGSQTSTPISEEKADFLSFIKCVKILKRKMRNRYEQKVSNEPIIVSGVSESETISKEHEVQEQAGPLESDVTDIFLPVPSTSQNNLASQGGVSTVDPSVEGNKNNQQAIETEKKLEDPNSDSEESDDSESSKT